MNIIEALKSYAVEGSRKCCMVDDPGLKQTRGRNCRNYKVKAGYCAFGELMELYAYDMHCEKGS
jgi:hypothetical protein